MVCHVSMYRISPDVIPSHDNLSVPRLQLTTIPQDQRHNSNLGPLKFTGPFDLALFLQVAPI